MEDLKKELETLQKNLEGSLSEKSKKEIEGQFAAFTEKMNKASEEQKASVQKQYDELKALIEKNQAEFQEFNKKAASLLKFGTESKEIKSFDAALEAAIVEKKDEIEAIVKNGGKQAGPLSFQVKAAIDMSNTATILAAGSASHLSLTSNTGIISTIRKRVLTYLKNVGVGSLSVDKPYAMWIEELDEQGTPIMIAEGGAKTKLSVRYEEREKKAKKIAVYGKVTTEMLRYVPQLISYIQNNLIRRMDIKTEDQLFSGDDTGENLKGLKTYASAFSAGAAANTITAANEFDVLNAIATQVQLAFGNSSVVFIHPSTLQAMKAIKSTTNEPLYKDYMDILGSGDMVVAGQRIVATPMVTAGEFVGGDLSVVNVQFLNQTNIQIGLDGNDFTNNQKTILVEQELVQFVSANDTGCLVKGTFASAKSVLDPAVVDA